MIPYRPDATSDILRAREIVAVRIESAAPSDWQPVSERFQQREVALAVSVVEVPKHADDAAVKPGDRLDLRVVQTENLGSRITAVPGVWSRCEVQPGTGHVAFSTSGAGTATELLDSPSCFRLVPTEDALRDVARADRDQPELSLADLLDLTAGERGEYGPLFANYVVDRLDEVLFSSLEGFRTVVDTGCAPELDVRARWSLFSGCYGALLMRDPAPIEFVSVLASGTVDLLEVSESADIHENLLGTYLPNLVGLEGGSKPRAASEVFPDPGARTRAADLIGQYPDRAAIGPLLGWIES